MSARYLTTTLPYVNADPHLGHALEFVQADALARTWRLAGDTVFFSTGTDEHGQKIYEAAEKAGQDVHAYADHYADKFRKLGTALDLSNDAFIRTIEPRHYAAATEMWRRCDAVGDIYKKAYTGMYCVGCESFKTEREMVGGHCIIHTNLQLQEITEENYFFRFSKYTDRLLEYVSRPGTVIPEWRREEAVAFVKGGLADFSISREKKRLSWGIPVPNDDTQVMYVWFDALTSYLSTLDWPEDTKGNFKKFWEKGRTAQVAGKDQVRFQSLMWQAMLMSAGIKNTDQIFYHGFINSGGQKMSKSLGNIISPYDLVKKYGTDATRYMLLRHINPMEDSDVTWERLDEWYTAHLTNGLGNLVARVMKLAETYNPAVNIFIQPAPSKVIDFKFNQALDEIWGEIKACDDLITTKEPFKLVKTNPEEGKRVISETINTLQKVAFMLQPFMPETSKRIQTAIEENKKPENLFPRL
ncbi:MAG: methionine--tRNA ligase [Patescibacteria group bacterium]